MAGRSLDEVRTIVTDGFADAVGRNANEYARKLRRILMSAVASDSADVSGACIELGCEASRMFCHARSRLETTHAALTDAHHRAIVAFLEWVADGAFATREKYLAATGLRWVWTRFGVDRGRIAAFQARMTAYRRAPIGDPAREAVAQQIEAAFADTPYPHQITDARSDEACDIALLYHEQKWPTLHPELIAMEPDAPRYLTPPAFRYFLPAYLLYLLGGGDTWIDVATSEATELEDDERDAVEAFGKLVE